MKYLLLFFIFMLVAFQWRQSRKPKVQQRTKKTSQTQVADIVACAHCGVHVPKADAIASARAHYCSPAHRQAQEP